MIRCVILLVVLLLGGCGASTVEVMVECASPDGALVATLYRVTNGERANQQQMRLNVRPLSQAFDAGLYSFSFRYGYDAIIRWQESRHLVIQYPQHAEILRREQVLFGTSQTYSATDPLLVDYHERASTHGYFMVETRCERGAGAVALR